MRIVLCILLAGCNSLLGNGDFSGPEARPDCAARGLPPTMLSGTVFAPNQSLPIYNALVYVPTAPLAEIPDGASGPTCASGSPEVTAFSDTHGNFKLENVPAGADVPLVIQVGKWRRAVTVPSVPECTETAVDASLTHLPRDSSEGHIPHIAIVTGREDTLECIARDIGIADTEITSGPSSSGRVRLYAGDLSRVDRFASGGLFEIFDPRAEPTTIPQYDAIMFGCEGTKPTQADASVMFDFTNRGGWLWLTHYESLWLQQGPSPWNTLGIFDCCSRDLAAGTMIFIDQSSLHGQAFADWLVAAGASATQGTLQLQYGQTICKAADPAVTQQIMYLDPANRSGVQMFTWDAAMGGRMVFSDVHLSGPSASFAYPDECTGPGSPQETAIMLELFDTPTCVN